MSSIYYAALMSPNSNEAASGRTPSSGKSLYRLARVLEMYLSGSDTNTTYLEVGGDGGVIF